MFLNFLEAEPKKNNNPNSLYFFPNIYLLF